MKATAKLVLLLYAICSLALGLGLAAYSIGQPWAQRLYIKGINWLVSGFNAGIVGTVLILLFLLLVAGGEKRHKATFYAFETKEGLVSYSVAAIEDFVRRLGQEFPEVKEVVTGVRARKRKLDICLRAHVWGGDNIPQLTDHVKGVIKARVETTLGIPVRHIHFDILSITPREESV